MAGRSLGAKMDCDAPRRVTGKFFFFAVEICRKTNKVKLTLI